MEETTAVETTANACQEYGENFVPCQTEDKEDCCYVGDAMDPTETNKEPIDCFKTYGPKFEDCERDWGWDCCMVEELALESNNDEAAAAVTEQNEEPIDCYKTLGPKFADCQTELGWDCCYVGDEMDQETTVEYKGPSTCSEKLGPEFTDCGMGYGLDCCYIDDGTFKHDHNEVTDAEKESLKHYSPIYESHEAKTCAEQFGANFTDCGNGFGLDCCYIDDGVFMHSHGDMNMNQLQTTSRNEVGVLRWLVLVALLAFFAISRAQRKSRKTLSSFSRNTRTTISKDDAEIFNDEDDVELKPLI